MNERNPYDYINNFKIKLLLYKDEHLYWKLFPTTFQGETIDLYAWLPPTSFNSWLEFYQLFIKRFWHNASPKKTLQNLYHCRQDKGESIRYYFANV